MRPRGGVVTYEVAGGCAELGPENVMPRIHSHTAIARGRMTDDITRSEPRDNFISLHTERFRYQR